MSFLVGSDTRASNLGDDRARRLWTRGGPRALMFAALVAGAVLLAAGCGGKPAASVASLGSTTTSTTITSGASTVPAASVSSSTPPASSGATSGGQMTMVGGNVQQMTKYAVCMRANGVPSFPDPNAQGQISFSTGSGVDPGSASFQSAQQACRKLLPNGGAPTPAQQASARRNALAFSACMRSHGVPNFPDPQFGSGGQVSMKISAGTGLDPQSPQFQAAQRTCQKDLPGAPSGPLPGGPGAKSPGGSSSG